jgi:stress response protein YsnF
MLRTVFATFETEAEAERALALVLSEADLTDSAVLRDDVPGKLTLESLRLTPSERAACEAQLKRGGYLLIAQAESDDATQTALGVLHGATSERAPLIIAEVTEASAGAAPNRGTIQEEPKRVVSEERIPIVEEDLRVGKREVVRGRATVHSKMTEVPVQERVELLEEEFQVETRRVNRRLTEEEVERSGLLQDRVVQFAAMREEAVVSKQPFVREEVVVRKQVTERVEEIRDTVRRTEVETERLEPDDTAVSRS